MTKWMITGSRNFDDKDKIYSTLDEHIDKENDIVIHGGAMGADSLAEEWCKKNTVKSVIVRPIRKDAGVYYLHRNAEMIGMAHKLIGFWDGSSRGTKFTIDYAKARNISCIIIDSKQSI